MRQIAKKDVIEAIKTATGKKLEMFSSRGHIELRDSENKWIGSIPNRDERACGNGTLPVEVAYRVLKQVCRKNNAFSPELYAIAKEALPKRN
jgi:hypothetical protein